MAAQVFAPLASTSNRTRHPRNADPVMSGMEALIGDVQEDAAPREISQETARDMLAQMNSDDVFDALCFWANASKGKAEWAEWDRRSAVIEGHARAIARAKAEIAAPAQNGEVA